MKPSPEFPIHPFVVYRKADARRVGILDIEHDLIGKIR